MKSGRAIVGAALVLLLAGVLAQGQLTPSKMPTQDDIQKMVEAKAYRPALRAIAQVLPVASGPNGGGYDKYGLLMMRGECLVQCQDGYSAQMAFEQAAQAAGGLQQNEAALSMAVLLKKSFSLMYTPRSGEKTKLNVADAGDRQKAMAALLRDELPGVEAKAEEALKGKKLPPILAVAPALRDLHAVEMQATGEDKQTTALAQSLGDRVNELIGSEIDRMNQQVQAIQRAASNVVDWGGGNFQSINGQTRWVAAPGASGLTGDQRQALREDVKYLKEIAETCDHLYAVARRYERTGQRWQEQARAARGVVNLAAAVYDNE